MCSVYGKCSRWNYFFICVSCSTRVVSRVKRGLSDSVGTRTFTPRAHRRCPPPRPCSEIYIVTWTAKRSHITLPAWNHLGWLRRALPRQTEVLLLKSRTARQRFRWSNRHRQSRVTSCFFPTPRQKELPALLKKTKQNKTKTLSLSCTLQLSSYWTYWSYDLDQLVDHLIAIDSVRKGQTRSFQVVSQRSCLLSLQVWILGHWPCCITPTLVHLSSVTCSEGISVDTSIWNLPEKHQELTPVSRKEIVKKKRQKKIGKKWSSQNKKHRLVGLF